MNESIPRFQPTSRSRRRLLVVDDEPAVAEGLRKMMRRYELVAAGSVDEAVAVLERDADFDLVLCDVMMPEKLGVELLAWVAVFAPELCDRVVLMTGGITDPVLRHILDQADLVVLRKPFSAARVRALVAERGGMSVGHGGAVECLGGRVHGEAGDPLAGEARREGAAGG